MKSLPSFTKRYVYKNISLAIFAAIVATPALAAEEESVYELGSLVVNQQPKAGTQSQIDQ